MKKDWMIKESELDDDQIKVLTATLDKSCVVAGCAGSGKSVLALIKAQRIQKERGDDYKIIVFTKALCAYMNSGCKELGLHNEFSYHEEWKWKKKLKRYANGMCFMVYARDENGEKIPNKPSADYIIVDEIQDFEETDIKEFINAAKKNFFFFGDTAQSIYERYKNTVSVEDIGYLLPMEAKPKYFELYRNYRLPIPVARLVQYVGVDLPTFVESTYKSEETETPYLLEYDNQQKQIEAIQRIIKTKELNDVAILVPDNDTVKIVGNMLKKIGANFEQKYEDREDWHNKIDNLNFATTNPKLMTYYSAKGLQFETIFLPLIENFSYDDDSDRKALYVAMTRTYRNLYVMYSGILPEPVSDIPQELYKTSETDEIDDI